jgi:glutathione peroxidase-family protein
MSDALLLKDLLRYSLEINEVPSRINTRFKKWELQNWIVRKNNEIVDYYNRTLNRKKLRMAIEYMLGNRD